MGIFEILQVFDWISPLVETGKDVHHAITDGEGTTTIWLPKHELSEAKTKMRKAGIKVVSDTWAAFDAEAGIDVPDSQVNKARNALGGISNW